MTDAIAVDNNNGSLDNVFSYWFLQGPAVTGVTGNTAYALGENEAIDLYNCWLTAPKAGYSGGLTLFADAETDTGYWYGPPFTCDCASTAHWQANVNVISGFAAEAASLIGSHETAGVYGGLSTFFNSKIPGQVWPNDYFIWDAAGGCSGYITHPTALQSTTYYETAEVDWHSYNKEGECLAGGQGFSMWQYYTTGEDYELTPQQGNVGCFAGKVRRCGEYFVYGYGTGTK